MSGLGSLLRRRTPADVDVDEQLVEDLPPIADGAHQTGTQLAARAATVGLFACLALGPLGFAAGGLALAQAGSAPPAQQQVQADQTNEQAVVGEFAQRVVIAWLGATQDHPEALLSLVKDAQFSTLPREAFTVRDATMARITQADGTWSVTVAATVTDARKVTARRFYQVPVRLADGTVSALTLPAPVSPPPVAPAPTDAYREQLDVTGPQGQAVTQFLAAYLTGAGDVGRYLTPGISLESLSPAPYTAIRVDDLRADTATDPARAPRDGQRLRVLATATAVVTEQQSSGVAYALTITARAGRWEITAIDPAPAYTPKTPVADPATGTTPASSETGSPAPSGTSPASSTP